MSQVNTSFNQLFKPSFYIHDFWDQYGDPNVSHLPLVSGGPWKIMMICFSYWLFIRVIGPMMMKNREPFDLRALMLLHNSFLIGINGIGFIVGLWITDLLRVTIDCGPVDRSIDFKKDLMIYLGYIYLLTKIIDFGDTIFFILRKRYHQATFLHVFHHGLMPLVGYIGLKFHPYGYSGFLPAINILIHAVMYSYYALACAGPEMKKHLWWKKHITQMQLVQFVLVFLHALNAIVNPTCKWPKILGVLEGLHAVLFFFLFYSFYQTAYVNNEKNNV